MAYMRGEYQFYEHVNKSNPRGHVISIGSNPSMMRYPLDIKQDIYSFDIFV